MVQINNKAIEEISQKSPTAEAFFSYAAKRERNVREGISQIPTIRRQMEKEGYLPVPQDLLSVFKELERDGVGKLQGRDFKWSVPIKNVGMAASGAKAPKPETKQTIPRSRSHFVMFCKDGNEISVTYTTGLSRDDLRKAMEKLLTELS